MSNTKSLTGVPDIGAIALASQSQRDALDEKQRIFALQSALQLAQFNGGLTGTGLVDAAEAIRIFLAGE